MSNKYEPKPLYTLGRAILTVLIVKRVIDKTSGKRTVIDDQEVKRRKKQA